ncbi:hypothetical protein Hdeb2414_s0004g00120191 [Helianthus debilis subsp. tardiflorus]
MQAESFEFNEFLKHIQALYQSEKPEKQETTPPDSILEDDMLELLLKQFLGFKDVRMIHAKLGSAFVKFDEKNDFLLQCNPRKAQVVLCSDKDA